MSLRYIHVVVIHNWLLTCIQIPLYTGTLFILLSVDEHWTVSSSDKLWWSCYKDTLPSAPGYPYVSLPYSFQNSALVSSIQKGFLRLLYLKQHFSPLSAPLSPVSPHLSAQQYHHLHYTSYKKERDRISQGSPEKQRQ